MFRDEEILYGREDDMDEYGDTAAYSGDDLEEDYEEEEEEEEEAGGGGAPTGGGESSGGGGAPFTSPSK